MASKLPPFEPVSLKELRALWVTHRDNPEIHRLILEVQRYREVIHEIDGLSASIEKSWLDAVGGNLVALWFLKKLMNSERFRVPRP